MNWEIQAHRDWASQRDSISWECLFITLQQCIWGWRKEQGTGKAKDSLLLYSTLLWLGQPVDREEMMGSPTVFPSYQLDNDEKDSIEVEPPPEALISAYPSLPLPEGARWQVHLLPVNVNELWQVDRSALFPLWLLLLQHCRKVVPVSGLGKDIPQGNSLNITCQEE